jgi:Fe2+ or Zn2+ uptake regulation protein
MNNYAQMLKDAGLKATFQRMHILHVIDEAGHMSIEDIYEEVTKVHPSLSLATIYKNIELMVEKGVVVEVPIIGKKSKYELAKEDHIHLVCVECGTVEDKMCVHETEEMFRNITKNEDFKLSKRQVNLYGICHDCQAKQAS